MRSRETGSGHQRFKMLCALAQAESLSGEERSDLDGHLASCAGCRKLCDEYARIGGAGMTFLRGLCEPTEEAAGWDNRGLRERLMAQIRKQRRRMAAIRTIPLCWFWNALKVRVRSASGQ